jgi:hypothetical protein
MNMFFSSLENLEIPSCIFADRNQHAICIKKKKKPKHNPNKYGHDNLGGKYLARPKGEL